MFLLRTARKPLETARKHVTASARRLLENARKPLENARRHVTRNARNKLEKPRVAATSKSAQTISVLI